MAGLYPACIQWPLCHVLYRGGRYTAIGYTAVIWATLYRPHDLQRVSRLQSDTVQPSIIQYSTTLHNTTHFNTLHYTTLQATKRYSTTQYSTIQYNTIQHIWIQHYSTVQYKLHSDTISAGISACAGQYSRSTVQYRTVQCSRITAIQYTISTEIQYSTEQYSAVLYSTVQYSRRALTSTIACNESEFTKHIII